jgi:superfamily II DNA or RNA helicase
MKGLRSFQNALPRQNKRDQILAGMFMLTLAIRMSGFVPCRIQRRGEEYFRNRAVSITDYSSRHITAAVRGSEIYQTNIDIEADVLTVNCTCPFFVGSGACKHIWATVLEADKQGLRLDFPYNNIIFIDSGTPDAPFEEAIAELDSGFSRPVPQRRGSDPFTNIKPPSWEMLFRMPLSSGPSTNKNLRELCYYVNVAETKRTQKLTIDLRQRSQKKDGTFTAAVPFSMQTHRIEELGDPLDRRIFAALAGARSSYGYGYYGLSSTAELEYSLAETLLPLMTQTSRCFIGDPSEETATPMKYDSGPFRFEMSMEPDLGTGYVLKGILARGDVSCSACEPLLVFHGGFAFWGDRVSPLIDNGAFHWLVELRKKQSFSIANREIPRFVEALMQHPSPLPVKLPEEVRPAEIALTPVPMLRFADQDSADRTLYAMILFVYGDKEVAYGAPCLQIYDKKANTVIKLDGAFHEQAAMVLTGTGAKIMSPSGWRYQVPTENRCSIKRSQFVRIIRELLSKGWRIEGKNMIFKRPGSFILSVSSGVDWFDLNAQCEFDGETVDLPDLLAALKKGDPFIQLGNGALGMLPEEWLKKYGKLAQMGEIHDETIRFKKSQALLIDALLAEQEDVSCDATFRAIRDQLRGFAGIKACDPPPEFRGNLRPYQCEGLGWFGFLQTFGLGGCLADDMGLGKTVQVLALLSTLANAIDRKPSLIVVPRSLVFNWVQESARFAPTLRVLDFSSIERQDAAPDFTGYHIVLVTYGTLRRDIEMLRNISFHYVVLDEAQAIKNASTITARAARLLKGQHRLALSGTPIENHVGELWSIFEFLNPGMLGSATVFGAVQSSAEKLDENTCALLRQALKPFILRRTKGQVAVDLPSRTEETIFCELDVAQRKDYNRLRDYYRKNLLNKIEADGMGKAKIMILEALLRLRQASCHPGLIDRKRVHESSAKLDTVLAQVAEVTEEGHKCLVFSQFTTFLSIVRDRLDSLGTVYEYLDGQTRDRQARVERFQNDPACAVFLISLKAGGLGLNLTAAEYVFLLDPWWNPATEAQAIDRTHRIGQTRPVMAYRLICKDTVEEKVMELQSSKRKLADAIINADESVLRSISSKDLELLLG